MTDSLVYVVDDDHSMRMSLDSLLSSEGYTVRTFESAQAFLDAIHPELPACLVLDVRLRGASGLEFQRELGRVGILTPIVFITGHGDVPMSVAAMKAGAVEFLLKPFRDQDLLDAVHNGIEQDRRRRMLDQQIAELRDRYQSMTPREREIMPLVASGLMNKQIAMDLKLSEVTVKVHRAQVMAKMRAKTLPDLVRIVDRLESAIPRM
ncbi:response regulator transcription factor [Chelatococcus asaccharovorans]|uniref:response regulator transcription factor n=1 Tax=Chelatococcus asaccharovorans TaxID=28210 RepID=UPI00224C6BF2|nr:response regulator transcription factor [Chelatococcus asaccharovorans]CAH1651747.1 Nodulation protein W [Chelatococcus asaccharovorans]CAH1693092.1 Nodulation protein W [Chelatococcus asaccharovorans]